MPKKTPWQRLSPAQQWALQWAAMPDGTDGPRPKTVLTPLVVSATWRALQQRGYIRPRPYQISSGWEATDEGRAIIPVIP